MPCSAGRRSLRQVPGRRTLVTPPGEPQSHHNGGGVGARFLIVQDGGLHCHARRMEFVFLGQETG